MVRKQKASVEQNLNQYAETLQTELNDIQQHLQSERNRNLHRWNTQRQLLTESIKNFDAIRTHAARVNARLSKQKSWEDNFKCDGLPHCFQPRAIHWYISKWEYDMEAELQKQQDWSLQRNELSILTQDSPTLDKTLATIKASCDERGVQLVKRIHDVDYILDGVREAVDVESGSYTKDEKLALQLMRNLMLKNLMKNVNLYTFQILKNMEREMEPVKTYLESEADKFPERYFGLHGKPVERKKKIDVTSLERTFDHDNFSFYLWALRDVPQPPRTNADRFTMRLASFGGEASFPYFADMQEFAFRSYWVIHDHYSIHSPTYIITDPPPPVVDLHTSLILEWNERDKIDQEKIVYLDSKRVEFENTIQTWNAEHKQKQDAEKSLYTKPTTKKKRKQKAKKHEKLTFGDFKTYDSQMEYIAAEDNRYMQQLWNMYPDSKSRVTGEINLRNYQVLGGVFHFEFLPKPSAQTHFYLNQMLRIRTQPTEIINYQTIKIPLEIPSATPSRAYVASGMNRPSVPLPLAPALPAAPTAPQTTLDVPRKSLSVILKENERPLAAVKITESEHRDSSRQKDYSFKKVSQGTFEYMKSKLSAVDEGLLMIDFSIKLPPNIIWVVPPSVCYWEPWEYSVEFERMPEDEKNFYRNYKVYQEKLRKRLFKSTPGPRPTEKVVTDFVMQKIPKSVDIKEICKDVIIPSLPYHYETLIDVVIERKTEKETQRKERIQRGLRESSLQLRLPADFEPKPTADLTPPMPLFAQSDRVFSDVQVVRTSLDNDDMEEDDSSAKEILFHFENEKETLEDEFRPSNILFSEFYRQIVDQASNEIPMTYADLFKANEKFVRLREETVDNDSTAESQSAAKRQSKRKEKRPKIRPDVNKFKESVEEKQLSVKPEEAITGLPNREFRGSQMHEYTMHPMGRWTNRKITNQKYDEETRTISFRSPCFGAYALIVNRYQHMPYKSWQMIPRPEKPDVIFYLTTQFVDLEVHISSEGYKLKIPSKSTIPVDPNLPPLTFFRFKQMMCNIGLNVFPERDACCYIKDIVEKHLSLEYHTYYTMACFCRGFQFQHSPWNRLSHRRRMVMSICNTISDNWQKEKRKFDVLITPNECYCANVKELCSLDLSQVDINYEPDPKEQEYQPDLFFLLESEVMDYNFRDDEPLFALMFNIAQFLWSVRPLSFS